MSSDNQKEQKKSRRKLYIVLGVVFLILLVSSTKVWLQNTYQLPSTGSPTKSAPSTLTTSTVSTIPTVQINIPKTRYPTIPPSAPTFTISIHSLDDSGITGTATFKDVSGTVAILLHLDGLPSDEDTEGSVVPVELHYGTCTDPGLLAYPMAVPEAGESETDLSISLKQLNTQKPLAVILYRSVQDHTAIACGDVQ